MRRSGGRVGVATAVGERQADRRAGSSPVAHSHRCDERPGAAGLEVLGAQPDRGTFFTVVALLQLEIGFSTREPHTTWSAIQMDW